MKLKLSELPDEIEVSYWGTSTTWTVAELKREIMELCEPHHERKNWSVITRDKWCPSAETMVDNYIDDEADDLFEDAAERIEDFLNCECVERIQTILDEAMPDGLDFWTYGKDVEIDIFPPGEDKSE